MAMTMETYLEIEQIRQLKYRYFRALDCHDWTLFETCLAEDVKTALDSGKYSFDGCAAFVEGLKAIMDRPGLLVQAPGPSSGDRNAGARQGQGHLVPGRSCH
jgi:hypothetical protein